MRKLFLLLIAISFALYLPAQSVVAFHEDFELPSLGDSLQSSTVPVGGTPWEITTHLSNSGSRADSNRVQFGKTVYLTSNTFSTIGYSNVSLQFAQICKLFVSDGGVIDVSIDGGTVWTVLTNTEYKGVGILQQGRFCDNSYSDWMPGDTLMKPTNAWWKNETFDISSLASNQDTVKLRFRFADSGNPFAAGKYGWLLDDIKVFAANNELGAPVITLITPIIQDSVSNTGPFQIKAFIKDASAITSAQLIYTINGGNDNVIVMTNTADSTYVGEIPSLTYNNVISYKIVAVDQYGNQSNTSSYSFLIKKAPFIVEIGSGTSNNYYAPIYVSSATNANKYSYSASLYTASEINAIGYIKSIAWNKANAESYALGNATFKIYLKEVSDITAPSSYTNYTSELAGATLVYSNLTQNISANTGWDTFNFNVDSFLYGGQKNLLVMVEFYRPGNATGGIKYYYTSTPGRAYTFSGSSVPPGTTSSNYLAHVQFGINSTNFNVDAGISAITSPSGVIAQNISFPVKVRVKNYGTSILTKANVHWSLDGIYQNSTLWTGNLAQDMISAELQLGNPSFTTGPHVIKAWTELPNDSIDNFYNNDTMQQSVFACNALNGTYTVGDATSVFPTFTDMLFGLTNCGINGPVVFKIKSGTYQQQFTLPVIAGTSALNTITFESESGIKTDVVISYAASAAADNWVVKLDGSNYITFKNITIKPLGATYGRGIELALGASFNTIEGCKIEMQVASATGVSGIYSGTTVEQYNTFVNNEILNGNYGIYISGGSSSILEKRNIITGNTIFGFDSHGIYSAYQDSVTINSNTIENGPNATAVYGIYAYYNDNLISISKNKVYVHSSGTSANYGIDVSNSDNTAAQPGIVANNFITQSGTTGAVYGLYSIASTYQKYVYNSVNVTSGSASTGRAFYSTTGSNIDIYNNNFVNTGGGYAYYVNAAATISNSNYNNIYATGPAFAYWGTTCADLATLRATSNKETNSITVNPGFITMTDLHVNNPFLNNKGIPVPYVLDDIDGEIRSLTTPDIGADEFQPILNDAGITQLVSPSLACAGTGVDVIVKLKNFGIDTLTSVSINWEVNGILQPSVIITDTLANLETADVLLSSFTFSAGTSYTIKAWTFNPNNVTDDNFANDTLTFNNYVASLSGIYTIGSTGANYTTINLAVADMIQKGICGPTVFNIQPGTYNENIEIPEIAGSSLSNTITFQSLNGDSTSVVVNYSSTAAANNYVIRLNGADNIILKNISIHNNGGQFSRVIELTSSADNNKVLNNVIKSSISTSTTSAGIYNSNSIDQYNVIKNNNILNGYYGIFNSGTSTTVQEKGNAIEGNTITGFYYYGIYSYYQDSVTINSNVIENGNNSASVNCIYAYYNDNIHSISKNKIYAHGSGSSTNYGIYIYNCDNTVAQPGIVANNFITQSGTTGTVYGISNNNSTFQNYNYNSVNVTSGSSTSGYAFYATSGGNVNLYNNSFSNTGGGYAYFINTIAAIDNSDFNNLYTTGANFASWTSPIADLSALQLASGKDVHSISTDPTYFSVSDLHSDNPLMCKKGTPISGITTDIDGETRNLLYPCIGADEYSLLPNDAKVKALYTLGKLPKSAGSPHIVKSIIENKGSNTLYNLNVNLTISGSNTFANTVIIDSLVSGETDTIGFAGFTPSNFGSNNVQITVPADDMLSNNQLNYLQSVTDTVFSYADTSKAKVFAGLTGEGLYVSKYHVYGSTLVSSVKAYITSSNTLGQKLYGVILNRNGVILDTSIVKIITATDTNNWVDFYFVNPQLTTVVNNDFYIGIAQKASTTGNYFSLGCQAENPTRNNTFFYTSSLLGGALTQTNQNGRFMIEANLADAILNNASVSAITSPVEGCGLSNETVTIRIQNSGLDAIYGGQNTLTANYALEINGILTNIVSQQVSDTILTAQNKLFTFTTPVNLAVTTTNSSFKIVAWVDLQGDPVHSNDTLVKFVNSKYIPSTPVFSTPVFVNFANNITLTASAADTIEWFTNYNDTSFLAKGSNYITPLLYDSTTYWVRTNTTQGNSLKNVALSAVASHSGGGSNDYAPAKYNDGVIPAYGTATVGLWGWTSGNGWIEYTWTTPQRFDKVVFYKDMRELATCTFQYWNGSAYVDFLSYNNSNYDDSISFPAITTTKLRFFGIYSSDGSPSFREIQVFESVIPGCQSAKLPLQVIVNNVPAVDAGINAIISPVGSAIAGVNTPVTVILNNWGTSDLTSVSIGWTIDGVAQTPINWTGTISSGQLNTYQLSNIAFIGGIHTIKAWTYNPNNIQDLYTINDTASSTFIVCMSGNFTIGATGNFPTFNAAVIAIDTAGICGNVIFDVQPGTYNEQLLINKNPQFGPNTTVTFRSQNGISSSVILTSASGSSVVKLKGADYIRFEKISIKATANVASAIEISDGADYNIFDGNTIESQASTTAATDRVINSSTTAEDNYNQFVNNTISGGYHGIYWEGGSSTKKKGNIFSNNIITNFNNTGLYLYYNDSVTVSGNQISNSATSTTVYALSSGYTYNSKFTKNKIHLTGSSSSYGMYFNYNNYSNTGSSLVDNNFVTQSVGASGVYGISNSSSENMNYYHNSVNITAGSASAYSFYSSGGTNINVVNNNLSNTGGGYAYYVSTIAAINISNFNNLYVTGTNLAYWTSAHTSLASLRISSTKDTNSVVVNPLFASDTDLHILNFELNAKGTPLTLVTDDIDGDVRDLNTPDIGADEFTLPANDAGAIALTTPVSPAAAGTQDVKVIIRNYGASNLATVNIQWSVNGLLQPAFPWTGNLVLGDTISATIGSYNLTASSNVIKVWTSLPNGAVDGNFTNDTITGNVTVCTGALAGTYTIGGTSADYPTINAAAQSLHYCGVNAAVVFNINQGTYHEQVVIDTIPGASAINTVTFKSANNDSTSVLIDFAPDLPSANFVLKLNNTDYVRIKNLTISNSTQNNLGRVVELSASSNYNEISNNAILTVPSTVSSSAGIYSYNSKDENNTISNNIITGGYYGIYLYGVGTTVKENGNTIKNNVIRDFYSSGVYLYYQDSINVLGNVMTNAVNSGSAYGIYSLYCQNINYLKNKIILNNTSTTYGMYLSNSNNAGGNGLIANNFISQSIGTGTVYGVYSTSSSNNKYYYNSINVTSGGTTNRGVYFTGGTGNVLKNNSIVNTATGYAIYAAAVTIISESNYNNLFTTGNALGYWGVACSDLASWKTLSGQDAMSVSVDPDYLSITDLHVYTSALNNYGTPITEVSDDIDGETRSLTIPDIGADEFAPLPVDIGVKAIIDPAVLHSQVGGNIQIKCIIKNFGADSVSNFNVIYKAGNMAAISQVYTAYLHANTSDTVTFTSLMPVVAGAFEIQVYTSISGDGNHNNDTTKINYFGVSVLNIPYTENFDNTTEEWFSNASGSQWEKGVPSASVINTAHSAPNVWATSLNGNYSNSNTSVLYTPLFNNAIFKADTLRFWHWMDAETDKDGGYIEYQSNSTGPWTVLGSISADTNSYNWYNGSTMNAFTGNSAGWQQSVYKVSNLTNLGNTVQFRFVFNADAANNNNGWAIDDFELTLATIPADAGVIAITSPAATSLVGELVTVTVTVQNFGNAPLIDIPLKYQVGNDAVQTGIVIGTLNPGATANYSFTQTIQVANADYSICAFTEVFGDIYTQNDSTCKSVIVTPAANDVAISEILMPGSSASPGTTPVKVVIKNFGTDTQTSIPVSYQRGSLTTVNAIWTGSLVAGATVEFTFPTTMNVPNGSSFSICAFTSLTNDDYTLNDTLCKSVSIGVGINDVDESDFWLGQNMPNPTIGSTNIEYNLPVSGEVKFDIVNLFGQNVYTFHKKSDAGKHSVELNVNDLSAGVYYYSIEFNGKRLVKKMVVNK